MAFTRCSQQSAFKPKPWQTAPQSASGTNSSKCMQCGFTNHKSDECQHKNAKCCKCGKIGRLCSECKSTTTKWLTRQPSTTPPRRDIHGGATRPRVRYMRMSWIHRSCWMLCSVYVRVLISSRWMLLMTSIWTWNQNHSSGSALQTTKVISHISRYSQIRSNFMYMLGHV